MTSTTTSSGSVLGAATTAGLLGAILTNWKCAIAIGIFILILGLIITYLVKRRKDLLER